jgi:hypothetical protein
VRNKQQWGSAFRFGFLRVGREDFACIAAAMECPLDDEAPPPPGVASEAARASVAAPG